MKSVTPVSRPVGASQKNDSLNRLRVEFTDQDVQDRVAHFLRSRHFPAFQNLEVSVSNGAVTVSGEVCSFYEKQVALTSCQRVAGVLSLVDEVVVENHNEPANMIS